VQLFKLLITQVSLPFLAHDQFTMAMDFAIKFTSWIASLIIFKYSERFSIFAAKIAKICESFR